MAAYLLSPPASTLAQCEYDWLPGAGLPGVDGGVSSMINWDPDGDGPQSEILVVGGIFEAAGNVLTRHAAAWDGMQWRAMDNGLFRAGVTALGVHDGQLYAGVYKNSDGLPPRVLRWDGAEWQTVGNVTRGSLLAYVSAFASFNGNLVIAGSLSEVDGVSTPGFAMWDGKSWQPLGSGVSGTSPPIGYGLHVMNGELIVSGSFTMAGGISANRIAAWNGETWRALGSGFSSSGASAFAEFNSDLIAGGYFYEAGGIVVNNIARWDGVAWHSMGETNRPVNALRVFNGELIAAGEFGGVGGVLTQRIARWNGVTWDHVGKGIGYAHGGRVYALGQLGGDLYVGGTFGVAGGGVDVQNFARWDGSEWQRVGDGLIGPVYSFGVYDGELIAAGMSQFSSELNINYLSRYRDGRWSRMASHVGIIDEMMTFRGDLIVAGVFGAVDGTPANSLARWDGQRWSAVSTALAQDSPLTIAAMVEYRDELVIAGSFSRAGGVVVNNIARWDGTTWRSLGTGTSWIVLALEVFQGELIVGGNFTSVDGQDIPYLARWNGETWLPVGPRLNGGVSALAVHHDKLIVGGGFSTADGVPTANVAEWGGDNWTPLGTGFGGYGINDFATYNDELYASGSFWVPDGNSGYIARWDGENWKDVAASLGGEVYALQAWNGELVVGGDYPYPLEWSTDNYYVARLAPVCRVGDMNCDHVIDAGDVSRFVNAILEPENLTGCGRYIANTNRDVFDDGTSRVDALDIASFVDAVLNHP
ncbi:MAG: hypothetical protein AMXMBFR20_00670 [Planctomycetia bacterium]|nr:MAG: hypothetical protein B6D36_00640 [Planctomycetes bacterium UTPLA1]